MLKYSGNLFLLVAVCMLPLLSLQCNSGSVSFVPQYGDQDDSTDGDSEADDSVTDGDSEPCEAKALRCKDGDDEIVQMCTDEGVWVDRENCTESYVCVDGKCELDEVDGDNSTDGDDSTDGDESTDGDTTDGDEESWHCVVNSECAYGYECKKDGAGDGCVLRNECTENSDCDDDMVCVEDVQWKICIPSNYECVKDENCDFGYRCNLEVNPTVCVYASTCEKDEDCDPLWKCENIGNWNECRFGENVCRQDSDCESTEYCNITEGEYGECTEKEACTQNSDCDFGYRCLTTETPNRCDYASECESDSDCDNDETCTNGPQWKICEAQLDECQVHTDCAFGNKCNTSQTPNVCEWASECNDSTNCGFLQDCVIKENWRVCEFGTPDTCNDDSQCDPDQYCDKVIGDLGTCKSRNECTQDSDCEDGKVCVSNNYYNECVEANQCTVNTDCDYGYKCVISSGRSLCEFANECNVNSDCATGEICIAGDDNWRVCKKENSECSSHSDCPFNYMCSDETSPKTCAYASTCSTDDDCGFLQTCQEQENWKECKFGTPQVCNSDADCDASEYCDAVFGSYGTCKSRNECESSEDCADNYVCQSNGTYNECVEAEPCVYHTDCPIGYKCVSASPNHCEYANECTKDSDCSAIQECKMDGNWTTCQLAWNGACTSDANCADDEWCDGELGALGTCRSRSQCFVDADCQDESLVCESNGTWNECVPGETESCWFDFQCPEDWQCTDGECLPVYEGTCTNVEGIWTVFFASPTCLTFSAGTTLEFIPKDGCNGDIKHSLVSFSDLGTFAETGTGTYDVTFAWLYKCTAKVTVGTLMSLDCPLGCSGIQLSQL